MENNTTIISPSKILKNISSQNISYIFRYSWKRNKKGKISYKYFVFFELIGIKLPGKYMKGSAKEKLNSNFSFVFWKIESVSGIPLINP
jgi:hypothetical protein